MWFLSPRIKPANLSATLRDIEQTDTRIQYVSRSDYKQLRQYSEMGRLQEHPLLNEWKNYLIIPEGGATDEALLGVAEILSEDKQEFDAIYLPSGTGTTLAGLILGLKNHTTTKIMGISVLKAGNSLDENVERLLLSKGCGVIDNWEINKEFHFGGFAKTNDALMSFMNQLYQRTKLVTEPVYTAKTLFALYEHIKEGKFPEGSKIMMIHTGGLQGLRGYRGKGIDHLIEQLIEERSI